MWEKPGELREKYEREGKEDDERESEGKNLIFGGARRFVGSLDKPQPRWASPDEGKKEKKSIPYNNIVSYPPPLERYIQVAPRGGPRCPP
jgi:hypothetical protein